MLEATDYSALFTKTERRILYLYAQGLLTKTEVRHAITDGQEDHG